MNKALKPAAWLLLALLCVGCGKKIDTPYTGDPSEAVVPIDTGTDADDTPATPGERPTRYCARGSDGAFGDGVRLEKGNAGGFLFGRGGRCIHRPIRDVWATALNQPLMVWVDVSESSYEQGAAPPKTTLFFNVHYIVHNFITVKWDMNWFHTVQVGSVQAPEKILINYKKVSGTSHISYWEGSIILERVNDEITSFAMANQISASRTSEDDAEGAVRDVYGKLHDGAADFTKLP